MPPQRLTSGKIPLAIALITVSATYAMWQSFGGGQHTTSTITLPPPDTTQTTVVQNQAPPPASGSTSVGMYRDGTYTGPAVDAYYGTVQVQAIIQNGKLTNVKFLQHPSDRSTSIEINTYAMPILIQEAIVAQNANVDIASGATFTSEAFQQSLASALTQASAKGGSASGGKN